MKSALDAHRELLARDVQHEVVRLRSSIATSDDLPRALDVAPDSCLVVRCYVVERGLHDSAGTRATERSVVAVAVHAGVVPDPVALLAVLDACTLRPATADEVSSATDYTAALVSPLCLPAEVRLVADAALETDSVVYCPVGEGGVALGIRSNDLLAVTGAQVATLSPALLPRPDQAPLAGPARVIDLEARTLPRRTPRRHAG